MGKAYYIFINNTSQQKKIIPIPKKTPHGSMMVAVGVRSKKQSIKTNCREKQYGQHSAARSEKNSGNYVGQVVYAEINA